MSTDTIAPETLLGTWTIDPTHTRVGFSVKHAMVTTVRGSFTDVSGTIVVASADEASVSASIKTASISTGQDGRDGHLRSPDFFDSENFPEIAFESTAVEDVDGSEFVLVGRLTIKGVSREVRIDVEASGINTDHKGLVRAGFEGSTSISRKDFDLTWNVALETGGVLVGDKIKIELDVSAVKQ